jgi:hypothetical protein
MKNQSNMPKTKLEKLNNMWMKQHKMSKINTNKNIKRQRILPIKRLKEQKICMKLQKII